MQSKTKPLRIIHYTESLGGGVMRALEGLVKVQIQDGFEVEIVYLRRGLTPNAKSLAQTYPSAKLVEIAKSSPIGLLKLMLFEVNNMRKKQRRIVHLHSSWAGFMIRPLSLLSFKTDYFYTPHGYAFLRQDTNRVMKSAFKLAEILLGKFTRCKTLACGKMEFDFANNINASKSKYLGNYISDPFLETTKVNDNKLQTTVGNIGRITAAKNPLAFARSTENLPSSVRKVWIGDGDEEMKLILEKSHIEITGWIPSKDAIILMNDIDILIFTSLWEGLPIAALEALAIGIPIVSSRYPGVDEIVSHGETGYICDSVTEIELCVMKLLNNHKLRNLFGHNARLFFQNKFELSNLERCWKLVYEIER